MQRDDVPLAFPCGADFASMPEVARGRMCAECQTVVHDLSSMKEDEAREALASRKTARLCVRYLYDPSGRVVFGGDAAGAVVIPESRLRRGKRGSLLEHPVVRMAMLAAPLVLIEACGGAAGDIDPERPPQGAVDDAGGAIPAQPTVVDASADAEDGGAGDAGPSDAASDAPLDASHD